MKQKISLFLCLLILCSLLLTACSANTKEDDTPLTSYTDLIDSGKTVATQVGDVYGDVAKDIFKIEDVEEYTSASDILESLRTGKVDAALFDSSYVQNMKESDGLNEFDFLWVPEDVFQNKSAPCFHTESLRDQYNTWFQEIVADGTFEEITNRWMGGSTPKPEDIPKFDFSGENGTLRICDTGTFPPLSYYDEEGNPTGFDVEIASRFAEYMGMKPEFIMIEFGAVGSCISSGKADMAAAMLTVTEERAQGLIFGEPGIISQGVFIVPKNSEAPKVNDYTAYKGKKLGAKTGSVYDSVAQDKVGGTAVYYTDTATPLEDLRKGRIDGYITDLSVVRVITEEPGNEDLAMVVLPAEVFSAPMGAISVNEDMINRFNSFLATIKSDGSMEEIQKYWFEGAGGKDPEMPDIPSDGKNGTLKVATTGDMIPFSYYGNENELKGYSIELARRFAAYEGMDIEFATMGFDGLIPCVVSGKADLAIDTVSITEERKKSVLFTDSVYDDQAAIVVLNKSGAAVQRDYTYFKDKNIAVRVGSLCYQTAEKIGGYPKEYSDIAGVLEDVRNKRIDGFIDTLSTVRIMAEQPGNELFEAIPVPTEYFTAQIGGISHDQAIIDSFNSFLAGIKADGILEDMHNRWMGEGCDMNAAIPEIENAGGNGVLTVATCFESMPYMFLGPNGKPSGFSAELALRFGAYEGKTVEFADMDFSALIPYVISKKADISLANMGITEERKQSVQFTEPFFDEQHGILALKLEDETTAIGSGGIIQWLKSGIQRNLITDGRWKMIVSGLGVTMIISISAQIFGTLLGFAVCYLLLRKNKLVNWLARRYCGLINGTPVVVLLMVTYYIIFGNVQISNVIVAIVAFSVVMGAVVAQTLLGAIESVDTTEIEAARSIGFSSFRAFMTVTFPQAVRRALPAYTNGFVELVKSTAIVGYIAIQDMTRAGDIIRSRTYDAYFPILFIALIYLIMTTICVWIFKRIVNKVNGGISL